MWNRTGLPARRVATGTLVDWQRRQRAEVIHRQDIERYAGDLPDLLGLTFAAVQAREQHATVSLLWHDTLDHHHDRLVL